MAGRDWSEVVEEAVRRHVDSTGDPVFTRQELFDSELGRIIGETGSEGATPHKTVDRELQQRRVLRTRLVGNAHAPSRNTFAYWVDSSLRSILPFGLRGRLASAMTTFCGSI